MTSKCLRLLWLVAACMSSVAHAATRLEAERAVLLGKATAFADAKASGGQAVRCPAVGGTGLRFEHLPAARRIAIRYASLTDMGTCSLQLNDQPLLKVNFHSTGGWDTWYTHASLDLAVPDGATLTLAGADGDAEWSVDCLLLGDDDLGLAPDIWNLPRFGAAAGRFVPDWPSLDEYQTPEWFRDVKFGIWNHFTVEVVAEQGDWYYVGMYNSPSGAKWQNEDFVKRFGHPSERGFIDFADLWKCRTWDPAQLLTLYANTGAGYFVQLANHHDNFDNWNSRYQPFNAVNFGPKRDLVGLMAAEARRHGLRFGVSVHATPTATWRLFMPSSYGADAAGDKAGKPYDGRRLTLADGAGRFWEGYDPRDFYGPVHQGTPQGKYMELEPKDPNSEMFARQFLWRTDDLLKYQPDLLYFDTGLCRDPFGMPELAKLITANYYNKAASWNHGQLDGVVNFKYPDHHEQALVIDYEASSAAKIQPYPWQTDISIAGWSYYTGQSIQDATWVVKTLASNVARNGNLLLNLTLRADGSLDQPIVRVCEGVGAWLKANGEAIRGTRPFERDHEGETFFTRKRDCVYALVFAWPANGHLALVALKPGGGTLGAVTSVELLGRGSLPFTQSADQLTIDCGAQPELVGGVKAWVFKVSPDKRWVNDDDPGVRYLGWDHQCNLEGGEFNADVHVSKRNGAVCDYAFTGSGIEVLATRDVGAGSLAVSIDGQPARIVSAASGQRQAQGVLFQQAGLAPGRHEIKLVSQSPAPVALDALRVLDEPAPATPRTGQKIAFLGDMVTSWRAGGYAQQVMRGLAANGVQATMLLDGNAGSSDKLLLHLSESVLPKKPDWLVVNCSVADIWAGRSAEQYRQAMSAIVTQAQAAGAQVVLSTATLADEDPANGTSQRVATYNACLQEIADEQHCRLARFDMPAAVAAAGGGAQSKRGRALLVSGDAYLNTRGDELLALSILDALGLTADQRQIARNAWLDLPDICEAKASLTLRQYEQLDAMAARAPRPTAELLAELVAKALATQPTPAVPPAAVPAVPDPPPPGVAPDLPIKDGQTIVFLGDSITAMGGGPSGYARQVGRGLAANGVKANLVIAGVGGNTSVQMLARLDSDVLAHKPAWMTLSCGVNDLWPNLSLEQFEQNMAAIVSRAQAAGVKVLLFTATMVGEDESEAKNQQALPYNAFLRQLAKEKGCLLADLNAEMRAGVLARGGGAHSKRGRVLTLDGIHMQALGDQMMALGVLKALGLNPEQLERARDAWLDLPAICEVGFIGGLTLRQFEQLDAIAADERRPTSALIGEAVTKALVTTPPTKPAVDRGRG